MSIRLLLLIGLLCLLGPSGCARKYEHPDFVPGTMRLTETAEEEEAECETTGDCEAETEAEAETSEGSAGQDAPEAQPEGAKGANSEC